MQWQRLASATQEQVSEREPLGVSFDKSQPKLWITALWSPCRISVTFIDKDGLEHNVPAPIGKNLLEVAHDNEVDLEGACEGSLACSTCHVIVENEEYYKKLPEPCEDELDMLDLAFGLSETRGSKPWLGVCRVTLVPCCLPAARCRYCETMFLTRSEYDRGVNTFSPEGRIFQVEYAIEAIKLGSTAIGVTTPHGVVLAVEKRITSPLLEPKSIEKIMEIDCHMGCAMSGLTADAKMLIDHARAETQQHRFTYNEPMPVESCTQSLCDLALRFGEDSEESMVCGSVRPQHHLIACAQCAQWHIARQHVRPGISVNFITIIIITMAWVKGLGSVLIVRAMVCLQSRPFGVALLIAGWDDLGPVLFHTDPSGTYTRFSAKAIGSGAEGAQSSLVEGWRKDLSLEEAETLALATLKQVMEEKVTSTNVDIARVTPEYHLYTTAEIEAVMARL
ncbi:hypothetical protein QJQ45_022574 [Haematococcus lacustris]|nr:hypothetical protein QJQ45_022574 [Haematococcus lacustris]